jgi:hypothetical protein
MPNICSRITDPKKRKLCLARVRSEQSTSPDEAVKKISKKGSKKIRAGRY